MITGTVTDDEAQIEVMVVGMGGVEVTTPAVIDTGFTGDLTLPSSLIR